MTETTHPEHALSQQDDAPRKAVTPLTWLLLALAIVAFGWWYFANRNIGAAPETTPVATTTPTTEPAATQPRHATARRPASSSATRKRTGGTAAPSIREAVLLAHAQPRYPVDAQRRGVEGDVLLRIAVDASGVPTDIGYAERSGNPDLDRAALSAARDWRFRPATRGGHAVATTVNVPVRFALQAPRG
jgi:protein TonB